MSSGFKVCKKVNFGPSIFPMISYKFMKFTFVRKLYFFLFFIPCIKERIKKVDEF
jgi:hypothetical protein